MLFATVLGHVSNIVINVSAARKEFQGGSLSGLIGEGSFGKPLGLIDSSERVAFTNPI